MLLTHFSSFCTLLAPFYLQPLKWVEDVTLICVIIGPNFVHIFSFDSSLAQFCSNGFDVTIVLFIMLLISKERGVGKNRGIAVIGNSYKKFPIRKWTSGQILQDRTKKSGFQMVH